MKTFVATIAFVAAISSVAAAQVVPGTGVGSSLRVTVLDQTEAALIIAQVTITDARGVEQTATVDERGVAVFENLAAGTYQVKASAESFRPLTTPFNVRRGENRTTLRLVLATIEQSVLVEDTSAADRRDNGFTQTLSQEQIDSLPDDPDEMAEELARMAGPGAQIFVNGFRGGRMPPKDQIQQIRFHTNSFSAEYHEAGMIRVEVITKPGLGGWRGHTNFGFRDESLNATNAFAKEKGPEQMRRYMVNFQGPIAKGKTGLTVSFDGNSSYDSRTIVASAPNGPGQRARDGADRRDELQRPHRTADGREWPAAGRVLAAAERSQQPWRRRFRSTRTRLRHRQQHRHLPRPLDQRDRQEGVQRVPVLGH